VLEEPAGVGFETGEGAEGEERAENSARSAGAAATAAEARSITIRSTWTRVVASR